MLSLGIDVGGTTVKAAGLEDGRVLWTCRSSEYARPDTEELIGAMQEACKQLNRVPERVGLCVPGLFDKTKEHVTYSANLPGLSGVPLGELIAQSTRFRASPTIVGDANATGFDIYSTRRLSGRLLTLAIGAGVGGSVLDDGRPLFVEGESPGHIGQIDISLEGDQVVASDGGRGGVEGYLGAGVLHARYGPDPAAKIRAGDPAFRALVRVIRICHAIYRPHHVCLAGGSGIRLGAVVDALRDAVNTELTNVARPGWTLSVGESDYHAAAGAARIAADFSWSVMRISPSPPGRGLG